MKKAVLIFFFLLISLNANQSFINIKRLNKVSIQTVLKQLEKELSRQTPKKIDDFVILKKVYNIKNQLFFIKTINLEKANEIKTALKYEKTKNYIKSLFLKNDLKEVCNERALNYVLSRGAVLKFKWLNKKSNPLFDYNIDNRTCSSLQL